MSILYVLTVESEKDLIDPVVAVKRAWECGGVMHREATK